jgi:hypothetical protein
MGRAGVPLLLPLLPLLPPLLPLLLLGTVPFPHLPFAHESEQQSPNFVHEAPDPLQTAVGPPQTFFRQSSLQQSVFATHDAPSAAQLGAVHVPLVQLPLQQSVGDWHDSPTSLHESAVLVDVTQTPEHERLQQSEKELQVSPV